MRRDARRTHVPDGSNTLCAPWQPQRGGRVLVVDDEPQVLWLFEEMLKPLALDVIGVTTGEAALDHLRAEPSAMVFLDVRLPGVDGLEVLRQTRALHPEIPVVMMTAYGDTPLAMQSIALGAIEYLSKPLCVTQIRKIVQLHLLGGFDEARHERLDLSPPVQRSDDSLDQKCAELSLFYQVANAISYTLDYEALVNVMMQALRIVVPFDVGMALLTTPTATLNVYLNGQAPQTHLERAQYQLFAAFALAAQHTIDQRAFRLNVTQLAMAHQRTPRADVAARSRDGAPTYYQVPLRVGDRLMGMLCLSSARHQFTTAEERVFAAVASHVVGAIERVQRMTQSKTLHMESLVTSMSEGVVLLDARGRVVFVNPQARRLLGFINRQVLADDAIRVAVDQLWDEATNTSTEDGRAFRESTIERGGVSMFLRIEQIDVRGDEEHLRVGRAIILTDMSKEKTLAHLKDEFVSTVSHELRTPLTCIKEGVGLLREEALGHVNDEQREFLKLIDQDVDRLTDLITNLLDLSKIEAGKMTLALNAVDLQHLIVNVQRTYGPIIGQRHFTIQMQDLPPVLADKNKIVQVLTNLVSNAIKFTSEGGAIAVEAHAVNDMVECAVRDDGPGIAPEQLDRLFQKFQQVGTPSSQGGMRGTGLGLALCKELLELHHGWIRVESTVGQGTTFIFALPVYTAATALTKLVDSMRRRARAEREPWGMIALQLIGGTVWSPALHEELRQRIQRGDQTLLYAPDTLLVLAMADDDGVQAAARRLISLSKKYLDRPVAGHASVGPAAGAILDDGESAADTLAQMAIRQVRGC